MPNMFDSEIEAMKNQQQKLKEMAKESEDVKNGTVTEEEELKEPAYVLFNNILTTVADILGKDEVHQSVVNILNEVTSQSGDKVKATKELISLISTIVVTASHQSILFYDDLLKDELTAQFDNIIGFMNMMKADVDAHTGVLSVFKKHLSEIDSKLKIDEVRKEVDADI